MVTLEKFPPPGLKSNVIVEGKSFRFKEECRYCQAFCVTTKDEAVGYESEVEENIHATGEWVEMNMMQNKNSEFCVGFIDSGDYAGFSVESRVAAGTQQALRGRCSSQCLQQWWQ